MDEFLFPIICVTCQRRLAVWDEGIIGDIVMCPKCGSMVHVTPPPDWTPTKPNTASPPLPSPSVAHVPANLQPKPTQPREEKVVTSERGPLIRAKPLEATAGAVKTPAPAKAAASPKVPDQPVPAVPTTASATMSLQEGKPAEPPPVVATNPAFNSGPAGRRRRLLLAGVPLVGLAAGLGIWALVSILGRSQQTESSAPPEAPVIESLAPSAPVPLATAPEAAARIARPAPGPLPAALDDGRQPIGGERPAVARITDPAVRQVGDEGPAPPRAANDDEARPTKDDKADGPSLPAVSETSISTLDLKARLSHRIPEVYFPAVPMIDAVQLLSRMSAVPVSFDLEKVKAAGIELRDPVTVRLAGATAGEIFEALVAGRGLTCVPMGDRLVITVAKPKRK